MFSRADKKDGKSKAQGLGEDDDDSFDWQDEFKGEKFDESPEDMFNRKKEEAFRFMNMRERVEWIINEF